MTRFGLLVLIIAALVVGRGAFAKDLPGGASALSPSQLTAAAASALDAAYAKGGSGISFQIVQTSTIVARPGGPLVNVPDPVDREKSLGLAQSYSLSTYLESGVVTPEGFWSEIRRGPESPDAKPDFETGPAEMAALVRDGKTFRNDGSGWYETADPPGLGLDPATASLLPTLLRKATQPKDVPTGEVKDAAPGAQVTRALEAMAAVTDVPGIVAVDLAEFTEVTKPAKFAFDDTGRLVALSVTARNVNLEGFDLIVVTTITFSYPAAPAELPKPEPVYVAPAPVDQD
jgi:hypothetical protein